MNNNNEFKLLHWWSLRMYFDPYECYPLKRTVQLRKYSHRIQTRLANINMHQGMTVLTWLKHRLVPVDMLRTDAEYMAKAKRNSHT